MNQPTIFISSTVRDFSDLRSALKFWLDSLGYRVLMSECSDFPASSDRTVHESCLSAIDESDVFILLIGCRRGSWYKDGELSITHAEYRRAKELAAGGKPMKILIFVRRDVWVAKQERDAMARHLADYERGQVETAGGPGKERAYSMPSSIGPDASYIFEFLQQIAEEDKPGGQGNSDPPSKADWVRPFSTFQEIVGGIGTVVEVRTGLRRQRLRCLVIDELRWNLDCRFEGEDNVLDAVATLFERHNSRPEPEPLFTGRSLHLQRQELDMCAELVMAFSQPWRNLFLRETVLSGDFVSYDPSQGEYMVEGLSKRMNDLLYRVTSLDHWRSCESYKTTCDQLFGLVQKTPKGPSASCVAFPAGVLGVCLQLMTDARRQARGVLEELLVTDRDTPRSRGTSCT